MDQFIRKSVTHCLATTMVPIVHWFGRIFFNKLLDNTFCTDLIVAITPKTKADDDNEIIDSSLYLWKLFQDNDKGNQLVTEF